MAKCNSCNKTITKNSTALECSRCQKVVHATTNCSGLTTKQLTAVKAAENLKWTCSDCNLNSSCRRSLITLADHEEEEDDEGAIPGDTLDIKKILQDLRKEVRSIVTQEIRAITTSLVFCSEKVDEFAETMEALTKKIKDMEKKITHLENQNRYITLKAEALEQRNAELEQQLLGDLVEISGIPDINDGDLPKIVDNVLEKFGVSKEDVLAIKRLPSRKTGYGQIHIRVRQETVRQRIISSARNTTLIGKDIIPNITGPPATEKIYIREALTPYLKNLLWQAKQELKSSYKYIWIREGRLFVRKNENTKVFKIRTQSDIQSLQSNAK
ncbi:unnamed protein product [Euphydryas editha]|uniref:Zinc finger DNA binding protein n=1 Tax=Euphydryas editha TaxID=104508 RepID=A0AAU9U4F7_EUPED|nr:unnamed protein product [Euphydryas editha]